MSEKCDPTRRKGTWDLEKIDFCRVASQLSNDTNINMLWLDNVKEDIHLQRNYIQDTYGDAKVFTVC